MEEEEEKEQESNTTLETSTAATNTTANTLDLESCLPVEEEETERNNWAR